MLTRVHPRDIAREASRKERENKDMRMTLNEWMDHNGYETVNDILNDTSADDSVVPALCTEGCQVEPDGYCPHGGKSVMLALGVI